MAINIQSGEIIDPLDLITTPREIIDSFGISRGALREAMIKDKFAWIQIGRTIIINREDFLNWWADRPRGLDCWLISR